MNPKREGNDPILINSSFFQQERASARFFLDSIAISIIIFSLVLTLIYRRFGKWEAFFVTGLLSVYTILSVFVSASPGHL